MSNQEEAQNIQDASVSIRFMDHLNNLEAIAELTKKNISLETEIKRLREYIQNNLQVDTGENDENTEKNEEATPTPIHNKRPVRRKTGDK